MDYIRKELNKPGKASDLNVEIQNEPSVVNNVTSKELGQRGMGREIVNLILLRRIKKSRISNYIFTKKWKLSDDIILVAAEEWALNTCMVAIQSIILGSIR